MILQENYLFILLRNEVGSLVSSISNVILGAKFQFYKYFLFGQSQLATMEGGTGDLD